MKFNHKEIGKDRFEIEDVKALDDKQLLEYQIAVMQWYKEGGEVEILNNFDERVATITPEWAWDGYYYFPVPKPSYEERQAKWVEENGAKVGDKVKCLPFEDFQDGFQQNVSYAKLLFNEVAKIYSIEQHGISVVNEDNIWLFPYFALELVKPSYKPYEKADPAWLVKTDEILKIKNYNKFQRIQRLDIGDYEPVKLTTGWFSLRELFKDYEWYNITTGETRPFGEQV